MAEYIKAKDKREQAKLEEAERIRVEKEREETAQETQGKSAPLVEPSAEQQKHTDVIQPLSKMHSCITPTFPR